MLREEILSIIDIGDVCHNSQNVKRFFVLTLWNVLVKHVCEVRPSAHIPPKEFLGKLGGVHVSLGKRTEDA